jgi:endonuclease
LKSLRRFFFALGRGRMAIWHSAAREDVPSGVEYPTGVGPIDILAIDSDGSYVVFELKRGRVADKAIGQISRYMGWLITNSEEGTKVKGVIVAKDISQNLRHAVVAVPNVSLFEYHISFTLNEIKAANAR